jgi:glycosyltransferase involved in cell wall biosynthesis
MPRPLRALQVIGASKFGGDSIVVCDWLAMLEERGIEATLLATDPPVVRYARSRGLRVWPFEGIERAVRPAHDLLAVARLAAGIEGRFDIVHTNTTKGGAVGRTAAWLARIPLVMHTVHGFAFHEFSGRLETAVYGTVERVLGTMSDRVIFVNTFDRQRAIDMHIVPRRKALTVYNGVSEDHVAPGLKATREELLAELELPPDAALIVFVGRLAEQKGLRYLFEAIGLLSRRLPETDLYLAVVGDGEQRGECGEWVREFGVADRVRFLGFRTDAIRWTGGGDVFVLSSLWEGHSITLLEAMACGKPIVATDIKGNRETITDGTDGLLVRAADAGALAQGLERVLADTALARRLGSGARQTFLKRFTARRMLEATWEVYEDALPQKGLWPR